MKRTLIAACLLTLPLSGLAADLPVAVAANMQFAFEDIARAFAEETGIHARGSFNASGNLVTQITQGAPFDVFISADMGFAQKLQAAGFTEGAPRAYARGTLVLYTTDPQLDLARWQERLAGSKVTHIAVANPATAPYGEQSMRALAWYKLDAVLKPKLVFAESIGQAAQFAGSGAASAAFTAKSLVLAPQMKGKGRWIDIPAASYTPIEQGVVVIRSPGRPVSSDARRFADFLTGPRAQGILQRYGYLKP